MNTIKYKSEFGYLPGLRYSGLIGPGEYPWVSRAGETEAELLGRIPGLSRHRADVRGRQRSWLMYQPAGAGEERLPLVITCHGGGASALCQFVETTWDAAADKHRFRVLYPDALSDQWDCERDSEDEALLVYAMEEMIRTGLADGERIYLHGFSRGSMFVFACARHFSSRIAGIAMTGGTTPSLSLLKEDRVHYDTDDAAPMPMILLQGDRDNALSIAFTGWAKEEGTMADMLRHNMGFWIRANGCDPIPAWQVRGEGNLFRYGSQTAPAWFLSVAGMAHGQTPEETELFWELLFGRFRRRRDGTLHEEGKEPAWEGEGLTFVQGKRHFMNGGRLAPLEHPPLRVRDILAREEGPETEKTEYKTHLLLPVSALKALGFDGWQLDRQGRTARLWGPGGEAELAAGQSVCRLNGRLTGLETYVRWEGDTLYLPVCRLARALGCHFSHRGRVLLISREECCLSADAVRIIEEAFGRLN